MRSRASISFFFFFLRMGEIIAHLCASVKGPIEKVGNAEESGSIAGA